jgi:hypothetical protein
MSKHHTPKPKRAVVLPFPRPAPSVELWTGVRLDIETNMRAAGCDEQTISGVCERMHQHYLAAGMGVGPTIPPIDVPLTSIPSVETAVLAVVRHYEQIGARMLMEILALEVFLLTQQTSTGGRPPASH